MVLATVESVGGLLFAVILLGSSVIVSGMKGRWLLVLLGLLGFGALTWTIGALRLGKPDSVWARRFYDAEQMAAAQRRFAK